jgi:cell division protein FtsW
VGIFIIFSASSVKGNEKYGDYARYFKLHLIKELAGAAILFLVSRIDYHLYRRITPGVAILCFLMLLAVLVVGPTINGSKRSLLFFSMRFQPSELAKLTLIFYLALIFAKGKDSFALQGKNIYVHYGIILAFAGLIFKEPDLGTTTIFFTVALVMFFLAGVPLVKIGLMVLPMAPILAVKILTSTYQKRNLLNWLASFSSPDHMHHQLKQCVLGLANGGFFGLGYGQGKGKYLFLPEPFSDFVLGSMGEEWGFIGVCVVMALMAVLLWRGIRIALRSPDQYGYLLAGGITSLILIMALINAGVVVNLLPTTGIPFPFLSYGGSSLFMLMIAVGVLINISTQGTLPVPSGSSRSVRPVRRRWVR